MTDRNDIAKVLTDKEIEDLGAPYLSMAEAPPQASYNMPPPTSYGPAANIQSQYSGNGSGPLALGAFVAGSADTKDKIKQFSPYAEMRLRYGRSF